MGTLGTTRNKDFKLASLQKKNHIIKYYGLVTSVTKVTLGTYIDI